MLIKITGRTEEQYKENLDRFLTMACQICNYGFPLKKEDLYYREKDTFYLGHTNNDWVNVRKEVTNENYMIVEFNFRYDRESKKQNSIEQTMLAFLDFTKQYS